MLVRSLRRLQISNLVVTHSISDCATAGFLSSTWHIPSHGVFAGSCVGVICLVICLEFLRRLGKEYDCYLVREYRLQKASRRRTSDASEEPVNGYSGAGDSKYI